MKPKIRTPYFEIGTKNYVYGDKVLEYAQMVGMLLLLLLLLYANGNDIIKLFR